MNLSTNPLFTHGIDKLCTICHVILRDTDTSHSIFSTFEELESPINVLQVLQSFSNFNFCNGAEKVCTMCYGKTIEVYKFIQMCTKAHDNLQHYWKNIEAIKAITDVERDIKIEEISISPTRIIIDGREFLEKMETITSSAVSPTRPKSYCLKKMNLSANPFFTHGIEKLCTICHVILRDTDTSQSLLSTFEELESPMNVLQVLQSFSKFNFCNGAQMVCTMCYERTIEVYKFIQMCNKAHDNMQHYLKNIEASKAIKDVETNVKIEEISIEPTRIIIGGREFLEKMENERISKIDEMEMVEKEETSGNEEITISHSEIVTEGKTDSSYFDNLGVEKIDAQMHNERMGLIKCKDCHLVFNDKKELSAHRKEAKHTKAKPSLSEMCNSFLGTKYNLRSRNQRYNAKREYISEDLRVNQDRPQPLKDHEIDVECAECQEVFYNDKQLKIHMRRRHKKKFMCNDCGKVFTSKQYLNTHNHAHTGENPFTCLICQRVFAAPTSLRYHMMIHDGVKPHKCEQCNRRFTQAGNLRTHMNIHNGMKSHKCEQCDWRFTTASQLRRHMNIHNEVKPHKCEQCDRRFTRTSDLRTHMNIHNGVKPHKCEQCDRRFTNASNLRTHMNIHNGVKRHKCEQCDRRFTQASDLRTHMNMHNGVKPHKCEQCDRRFTQASNLRRHMNIHNGVKPHKCEQCDRRFTHASSLRIHMNMHNGVKPHKCEQCDRRFTQGSNLRTHMNIHNGVKRHKCEQCDRRFALASYLRRHMMIHNRKLSYKCDQCDKRFAVRPTLIAHQVAHQRIHTANNCTICDIAFDTSSALKVHLRSHNIVKKRVDKRTNRRDGIKGGPAASRR